MSASPPLSRVILAIICHVCVNKIHSAGVIEASALASGFDLSEVSATLRPISPQSDGSQICSVNYSLKMLTCQSAQSTAEDLSKVLLCDTPPT